MYVGVWLVSKINDFNCSIERFFLTHTKMVNIFFSYRTAIQEGSDYFESSTRKLHSNYLVWQSLHKQQQILPYCGINLKVVLHRNRMKPTEKFTLKSPLRFHCKIKSYNVFVVMTFLQENSECPAWKDYWNTHWKINELIIPWIWRRTWSWRGLNLIASWINYKTV